MSRRVVTTGESLQLQMIPGLARSYPVLSRLQRRLPGSRVVEFIEPLVGESLNEYAKRFSKKFDPNCFIVGVSFGGIVAAEISRLIKPKGCILISTVRNAGQLPRKWSVARLAGGGMSSRSLVVIGRGMSLLPRPLQSKTTRRLSQLAGAEKLWYQWAISAVVDWRTEGDADAVPTCHIHGENDEVFPIRRTEPNVVVRGGGHSIAVTHTDDVAVAILNFLKHQT